MDEITNSYLDWRESILVKGTPVVLGIVKLNNIIWSSLFGDISTELVIMFQGRTPLFLFLSCYINEISNGVDKSFILNT